MTWIGLKASKEEVIVRNLALAQERLVIKAVFTIL